MIDDDDIDVAEEILASPKQKRKKLMILLLPLLIVIGVSVAVYFAINNKYDSFDGNYNIIEYNKDSSNSVTVFYDLPELKTSIKGKERNHNLRLKINIELSSIDDLKIIEAITAKLTDAVIGHVIELNFDEVQGSTGLYWLKEEILYRFNLVAAPVKIKNINFSLFELEN
ncbi:MAG: hypothetical protein E7020_05400 [Alphaproteobacteria bacterium]|nr:hypothetical protein [Alphaproteobacteria bacterium]